MAHEHGPHICYCPNCGSEITADVDVRCNSLTCPQCGQPMRAKETGEYRQARLSASPTIARTNITTDNIPCPVCGYPVPDPRYVGERVRCAFCGAISETISQGVTIPSWLLTLGIGLVVGTFFGPTILASTDAGSRYLAKKARERIG